MKSEWRIRIVGEQCRSLGAEAYRLLCRILSARVFQARRDHESIWEPFPLPWTLVALWTGLGERQCYNLLSELAGAGFLRHEGVIGCPGQAHYRIVEAMAENPPFTKPARAAKNCSPSTAENCSPEAAKNCSPSTAKKCSARAAKKGGRLYKYSLREEMSTQEGRNSSLRSKESKGGKVGSLRSKMDAEKLRHFGGELAKLRHKLKNGD